MMVRPFKKGSCFKISTRSRSSSTAVNFFALSSTGLVNAACPGPISTRNSPSFGLIASTI